MESAIATNRAFILGMFCSCFLAASAADAADYRPTVLALDPVVYYSLDETALTETATNLATGASSAGVTGDGTYDPSGPEVGMAALISAPGGTSVRFQNNSLSTLQNINTAGPTGYTIAFWLNAPANPGGPQNLVGDGSTNLGFYAMVYLLSNGTVRAHAQVESGFAQVDTNVTVTDGNTHHVLARYNQPDSSSTGLLEVFIDGVLQASIPTTRTALPGNSGRLYMGRDLREASGAFITLDEVALWNRPLSDAEVFVVAEPLFSNGFE